MPRFYDFIFASLSLMTTSTVETVCLSSDTCLFLHSLPAEISKQTVKTWNANTGRDGLSAA